MISLYELRDGSLVFVDRVAADEIDRYGQQGYICVHEPDPRELYIHLMEDADFQWMEPQPDLQRTP